LPSYNEALPMSILEAMAFGLPVVTTPVGGIPEAITDGREGLLVRPGDVPTLADKLCALLDDPALARTMGREGRKKAKEKYSVQRVIPAIESLYLKLGAKPRALQRAPESESSGMRGSAIHRAPFATVVGHARFALIDLLRGTDVVRTLGKLDQEQWLPHAELEKRARRNALAHFERMRTQVPFYSAYQSFDQLPIADKPLVRKAGEAML